MMVRSVEDFVEFQERREQITTTPREKETTMHSFDAPSGATYHHNGDFSGFILVTVSPSSVNSTWNHNNEMIEVELPFEDLKALVAKHVRNEKIHRIESGEGVVPDERVAVTRLEELTDDEVLDL